MMASTHCQVVKTSVANNSPSQDCSHPDDHFQSRQIQYSLALENNEGSFSIMHNSELKDVRRWVTSNDSRPDGRER